MTTITFRVAITPIGKARARTVTQGGKTHSYTPDTTTDAENAVTHAYQQQTHHQWAAGIPLRLEVVALFVRPKSAGKRLYPTGRPDGDNILKLVSDALNEVAYADDAQIVSAHCLKKYGSSAELIVLLADEL